MPRACERLNHSNPDGYRTVIYVTFTAWENQKTNYIVQVASEATSECQMRLDELRTWISQPMN